METKVVITYKNIKYLRMKVKDGMIIVSSPKAISEKKIMEFVNDHLSFIQQQLLKQEQLKLRKQISLNSTINIFKKDYEILSTNNKAKVTEHFIFLNENQDFRKQIKLLFKNQLYELMLLKTKKYFSLMELTCPFPKIIIKDVKSKWGSYNKKNHEILYASELIFKDEKVYDYLIVHELSHILQFNHSKKFYDIVLKYCPNYKELKKELKEM